MAGLAVCLAMLLSVGLLFVHSSFRDLTEGVIGVVLVLTVLSPIISLLGNVDLSGPADFVTDGMTAAYEEVSEEAFVRGIEQDVSDRFSLSGVRITARGFIFSQMRAEYIRVDLSEDFLFSDSRAVREYVEANYTVSDVGRCEVVFFEA